MSFFIIAASPFFHFPSFSHTLYIDNIYFKELASKVISANLLVAFVFRPNIQVVLALKTHESLFTTLRSE